MSVSKKKAHPRTMPMKPQVVGWELSKRTKENAIIVSDSGTNTTVWARYMKAKKGQMHSCSGNLATMACGMPYAIAAQDRLSRPAGHWRCWRRRFHDAHGRDHHGGCL